MRVYETRAQAKRRNARRLGLLRGLTPMPSQKSVDGTVGFTPRLGSKRRVETQEERRVDLLMPTRGQYPNIYTFDMSISAWRTLMWLFFNVEANGGPIFRRGWKTRCAQATGMYRNVIPTTAVPHLAKHGLIEGLSPDGPRKYVSIRFCGERFIG